MRELFWYFISGVLVWYSLKGILNSCFGTHKLKSSDLEVDLLLWEIFSSYPRFTRERENDTKYVQHRLEVPQDWQSEAPSSSSPTSSHAWCTGSSNITRVCHFKDICYHAQHNKFMFIVSPDSTINGFIQTDMSSLVYLSGLTGKISANLVLDTMPPDFLRHTRVFRITTPIVLLQRYQPNNLFHILHTDLLPLYTLFHDVCSGNISECFLKYAIFFADTDPYTEYDQLYKVLSQKIIHKHDLRVDTVYCFEHIKAGFVKHYFNSYYNRTDHSIDFPNNNFTSLISNPMFINNFVQFMFKNYDTSAHKYCKVDASFNSIATFNIESAKDPSVLMEIEHFILQYFGNYSIIHIHNTKDNIVNLLCALKNKVGILAFGPKNLVMLYTSFYSYSIKLSFAVREFTETFFLSSLKSENDTIDVFLGAETCISQQLQNLMERNENFTSAKYKDFNTILKLVSYETKEQNIKLDKLFSYVSSNLRDQQNFSIFNSHLPMYPFPGSAKKVNCTRENGTIILKYLSPWNEPFSKGFESEYFIGYTRSNLTTTSDAHYHQASSKFKSGWIDTFPEEKIRGTVLIAYRGHNTKHSETRLLPYRYVGKETTVECPDLPQHSIRKIVKYSPRTEPIAIGF